MNDRQRRRVPTFAKLPDAEVIVVGGGPGGSALAGLLATAGHDVLLLDKARFPRHKACSEYINPEAVRILDEIGAGEVVRAAGPHRMERMVVHAPSGARFHADFGRAGDGRVAYGLSRYRLDAELLLRAAAVGATVVEGAHVRAVVHEGECAVGVDVTRDDNRETLRAPLIVGADGRHSVVRRSLGLDVVSRWPKRTGLVAHYRGVDGLLDQGELHVAAHGYAGLAPLEDGLVNVAFVADGRAVAGREGSVESFFEDALQRIPAVADKLRSAERAGRVRGVGAMAARARRTAGDGFLLLGDAASFLDPFTGEGIYEALCGAQLAAPVIVAALQARDTSAAALAPYQAARRQTFTAKRQVCWIVQGFIHSPRLMNYVTERLDRREKEAMTLTGVLADIRPAREALSPVFLARLLRP